MSFSRKIIRNKISQKFGNKYMQNIWDQFQTANEKRKVEMFINLSKPGTYKPKKNIMKDFSIKFFYKNDKNKTIKIATIKATDKEQAKKNLLDLYTPLKKIKNTDKPSKIKIKSIKEIKNKN
jgi:hypothetical protein